MHMMRLILAVSGDVAWHRLGLQDRQTAVFVLPGGGPAVNPTAWDVQDPKSLPVMDTL
jgi:hypothetical protein